MARIGDNDTLPEGDTTPDPVLDWYSKIYSRRVDLVGDYAGQERFLIEGDSLLLDCFSDELIDFQPGFQVLHAAWTVERFLRGLASRQCNFHVAFFEQHHELSVPQFATPETRAKYLLARAAIIRHLRANLSSSDSDIEVNVFSSVDSREFHDYLQTADFFFVMAHDGASPDSLCKRNILSKHLDALEDEDDDVEKEALKKKIALRQLIHWFMERGLSVALINGLEWNDTKAVTTVLESSQRTNSGISSTASNFGSPVGPSKSQSLTTAALNAFMSNIKEQLTEREALTVIVLSVLVRQGEATKDFALAFLRHTALLSQIRLSERCLEAADIGAKHSASLERFCEEATSIIQSREWAEHVENKSYRCDVADLLDGRLLAGCLQNGSVGTDDRFKTLVQALTSLDVGGLPQAAQVGSDDEAASQSAESELKEYTVLPFSNSVFDPHLAPVHLAVSRTEVVTDSTSDKIFSEVTHWHNSRRPIDPKIREDQIAKSKKQQFFANRRNQFFMAEMTTYAASLTNAVGKVLEPEIITTGAAPEKKRENAKPKPNAKGSKPTKKETMLANIAADKTQRTEASSKTLIQGWHSTCKALDKESSAIARYHKTNAHLLALNSELKRDVLEAEIRLYALNALLDLWVSARRKEGNPGDPNLAAMIFDSLRSFSRLRRPITKTISSCLEKTYKVLSLPSLPIPAPEGDRALAFKFVLEDAEGSSLSLPISATKFQLLFCGPYFDRSMDSAPDSRVPFEPDAWQRKVLDEIDAKNSLLVVAPTSAGKTFISFYAMKQVLQSEENDILVYVAPTKALVNQIAAEVQARFSKSYKYGGNSVWGIHTRDYRINNPTGCQILVTVPHILQIMLLAPSNANSWSKRVKWIIFDEVHCIGQAEDGLIWEQLLLMAPCPIIALSATIGNPDEFSAWLNSTQQASGNKLVMVQHPHRYSDLRKFIYNAPAQGTRTEFQGLSEHRAFAQLGLDACADFEFLHPVGSLTNRSRGIPQDLTLEARDCFTLWQSMSEHQNDDYPLDAALDPQVALPSIIKKVDVIKWENSLKKVLRAWMADVDSPFEDVLDDLGASSDELSRDVTLNRTTSKQGGSGNDENEDEHEIADVRGIVDVLPLLAKLHEQDALPGIIFNYDRGLCERTCQTLMAQLEAAEATWKESSSKWKNMLTKWEDWKKIMAKTTKRGPPKIPKKKGTDQEDGLTKDDFMKDAASGETSPWASFDPEKPIDQFHFADSKKVSQGELDKYEKELRRREVPEWLIRALWRGIGVHHAGLNRKYRYVCEMLFRRGYLRVVIATGTLALGINMPCKTVVFSGDSIFLTALNYRQAAGRAGRRGFDMLGNVVFHGISLSKINRLISSRLPDINGHFPITTTLVLRLCTLLNDSKNAPFAIRSVNALLSQPRLYLGGDESRMTVLHHLRFSIEYLRRQFLLDSRGTPLNLAGCVSHLYFTENSSFAFHTLLKDGYFHELCVKFEANRDVVLQELMLTLAHLFGRLYCRQADEEYIEHVVKRSPSIVFLPTMPNKAANILREHNESTLNIYKAYVRTFIDQHLEEPDDSLPLTQIEFGGTHNAVTGLQHRHPTAIRSPFVALSGHDDDFGSIHDLCATTRAGVFLEEAVIPYVGLYPDESAMPLNAYLYDFFNHGDVTALANANRIRSGDVWFVLNDFSMVLAAILTSLSNFMNITSESNLDSTDIRGEGEEAEERQEDEFLPEDSGYETASTVSMLSTNNQAKKGLAIVPKKKKKVADSWDDDADEEEELEIEIEAQKKVAEAKEERGDRPAWEEGTGLLNVLKAFRALKEEFDTKFRAMWA